MRVPEFVGKSLMVAGAAILALSIAGAGVADAASKKKKKVAAKPRPAVARMVDSRWQTGYADIVIDANTGRVLHESSADSPRHPASVTKVMTLYLLFEQIQSGRLKLDSQLPVSAYAARMPPSKLGVRPGSTISVEDAIQALVTRSANDVAVVVAEAISGDVPSFANLMTRRARQLGMSRTTFKNPNGLPDPGNITTARDLATLGRAVQERFPRYYAYFSTRVFQYRGQAIGNHNRMFSRLEGVDGIKTGYTNASGFNLLTSVKRDGRYIIAVVLGGSTASVRDARMAQLVTTAYPQAFAGRQTVARMNYAPSDSDAPTALALAAAPRPTPAPAPGVVPVPASNPRVAMASVTGGQSEPEVDASEVDEDTAESAGDADPVVTGAVPSPAAAPVQRIAMAAPAASQPAPAAQPVALVPPVTATVGSVAPIAPTKVKTVAVTREVAPAATLGNQPGILGTLAFSQGQTAPTAAAPSAKTKPAAKPVQVASLGATEIPRQEAEAAERAAAPRSGWAIQIGAYGSVADARAQLAKAKAKAGAALARADSYTEQATKGSTTIVRARFAGFDQQAQAQKACKALKGDFGCMVFRN